MTEIAIEYTTEQLHAAFIKPLRSAMLIDDQFPRYVELLEPKTEAEAATPKKDFGDLKDLLKQCEERGLLCDVENRHEHGGQALTHVGTSDLLVLDYHLIPNDEEDGRPAHEILCKLANSANANLVVVYTAAADLEKVKRGIAASFRGVPADAEASAEYQQYSAENEVQFSAADLDGYLRSGIQGVSPATKRTVSAKMQELGLPPNPMPLLQDAMHSELREKLRAPKSNTATAFDKWDRLDLSRNGDGRFWIAYRNVFIAIVPKARSKDIFEELVGALQKWNPSPLQLLLVQARSYLEAQGFLADWRVLADHVRQNALVYLLLAGEDPSSDERMKQLFRNVFGSVLAGLVDEVVSSGSELMQRFVENGVRKAEESPIDLEARRLELAKEATRYEGNLPRTDVIHELNQFLSSVPFTGTYLKTGSVFRRNDSSGDRYWVCVTADCSLIPREEAPNDKRSWEHEIFPNVPILALRLQTESGKEMESSLAVATQGRHLFIKGADGKRIALRIAEDGPRQPRPEVFLLQGGVVDRETGAFKALRISKVKDSENKPSELSLEENELVAVAQLRSSYADRILTQTGHHTTRIGVDFVSLGKDEVVSTAN